MSKLTQYEMILGALRKAGRQGLTVHQLSLYSNCPWKRIDEMTIYGQLQPKYRRAENIFERIDQDWVERDGRRLRLYRLVRVK